MASRLADFVVRHSIEVRNRAVLWFPEEAEFLWAVLFMLGTLQEVSVFPAEEMSSRR